MTIPIILAVIASALYAMASHIDKYLISKAVKNADYKSLTIISTLVAGAVMTIIYMFVCHFQLFFDLPSILLLLLNSTLYTFALIFWFKALNRDDTTIIIIMFQLIPVFSLFLSPIILDNQLISPIQLIGGIIVTIAAIAITYEHGKRKFDKARLITLALMTFVSFAYAIWFIIIRYINQNHDFNQTILWSNITRLVVGILFIVFFKTYRNSFQKILKNNGVKIIGLNLVNEMLTSFGDVLSAFAGTMASVAIVAFTTQGVEPFIVMLLGIAITRLFPKIEKENISKREVFRRTSIIVICTIGLACIEFG